MRSKSLKPGVAKSRRGKPSIGMDALARSDVHRAKMAAFAEELSALKTSQQYMDRLVDDNEALDAARRISKPPDVRSYAETAGVFGAANPMIGALGRSVKGAIDAPRGKRMVGALKGLKNISKGGLFSEAATGAVSGGGIKATMEGLELQRAKNKVRSFLKQHRQEDKLDAL